MVEEARVREAEAWFEEVRQSVCLPSHMATLITCYCSPVVLDIQYFKLVSAWPLVIHLFPPLSTVPGAAGSAAVSQAPPAA